MPKITHGGGATADGLVGIVDDANGNPWELDPERNVDGTLKNGEHPDREDREASTPAGPDDEPRLRGDDEKADGEEEKPSPGRNSSTSHESTPKTSSKK